MFLLILKQTTKNVIITILNYTVLYAKSLLTEKRLPEEKSLILSLQAIETEIPEQITYHA